MNGTEALIELLRLLDTIDEQRSLLAGFARVARDEMVEITDPTQRKRMLDLILVIEENLPRRHQPLRDLMRKLQVCRAAVAALSVHADAPESLLRQSAVEFVGSAEKWQALSVALVENNLSGWRDWRTAAQPYAWLGKTTQRMIDSNFDDAVPLEQATGIDHLPIEAADEQPAEALLDLRYSAGSVAELEAAAQHDPDLARYLNARIRRPAWDREQIWRQLGWDSTYGKAVDRRYRRLRRKLREQGAGIQIRDYVQAPGISDASSTTYREPLFEGSRGSGISLWQHRDPEHDENK